MKKEDCLNIFEKYILNTATDDEVKQLCFWIKNNAEIADWIDIKLVRRTRQKYSAENF